MSNASSNPDASEVFPRGSGTPAYQLAVVVDEIHQGPGAALAPLGTGVPVGDLVAHDVSSLFPG